MANIHKVKFIMIIFLGVLTGTFAFPGDAYPQLNYFFEFNMGYNLLLANSKISYEGADYSFNTSYMYFPFGIKIIATGSPHVLIDLGISYERRDFNRKVVLNQFEEDFKIALHFLKFPIHLRINLDNYNLFLSLGFSMNFVVSSDFSGTLIKYNEETGTESPDPRNIEVIKIDSGFFVGHRNLLRETFNEIDYTLNIGISQKYNINKNIYTVIGVNFEFSIIDIDKNQYYETYIHSLIISVSIGMNL